MTRTQVWVITSSFGIMLLEFKSLTTSSTKTKNVKTKWAMYVCNTEAHLCNHCCSGKATSITYYECVFLALCI